MEGKTTTMLLSEDGLTNLADALDETALVLASRATIERIEDMVVITLCGPSSDTDAAKIRQALEKACAEE
jgi:hypothetical protein